MISKYNEFLLEKEFQSLIDEMYRIVESKGRWTSDNTYEWDISNVYDNEVEQPDWIDRLIDKAEDFIKKIPKEKIKEYFVRLVNATKSIPEIFRKRILAGYLSIFLAVVSFGYLVTPSSSEETQKVEQIDSKIKKDIEEIHQKVFTKKDKASFEVAQGLVKTAEAGYSDDRGDTGNWITIPGHGQRFVGTNHGISAPILHEYLGRYPKKEDMINLSYETALKIYKSKYWNEQNLSEFSNQSVANIIYDGCVNQGQSAMREIVRDAYRINGIDIGDNSPFAKSSISKINKINQQKLFDTVKELRESRYREAATWDRHGDGWLNRLNGIEFNQA
jgi:lysozyme family protein